MRHRDAIRTLRRLARELRAAAESDRESGAAFADEGKDLLIRLTATGIEIPDPRLDRLAANLQAGVRHVESNPAILRAYLIAAADELEAWAR